MCFVVTWGGLVDPIYSKTHISLRTDMVDATELECGITTTMMVTDLPLLKILASFLNGTGTG